MLAWGSSKGMWKSLFSESCVISVAKDLFVVDSGYLLDVCGLGFGKLKKAARSRFDRAARAFWVVVCQAGA